MISVRTATGDSTRAQCLRSIAAEEVPHLRRLGGVVARLRRAAFLTQYELGRGAHVSRQQVARVEAGTRRTRRSTLRAMADVLTDTLPTLGEPDDLTDQLVDLAGPALAPESSYAETIQSRRVTRVVRWDRQQRLRRVLRDLEAEQRKRRREERRIVRQIERGDRWTINHVGL